MIIKMGAVIKAMHALNELYARPIQDTKTAMALYNLMSLLGPSVQFHREREQHAIEMAHGKLIGDQARFENSNDFSQYQNAMRELNDLDIDIGWSPVVVRAEDVSPLSMKILDGLAGLVQFSTEG